MEKCTNSAQSCPKASKRLRTKNHYETAVQVHIARTLCIRVRTANVFLNKNYKKRLRFEHVCKVYRFRDTVLIFAWVLQQVLKALQNHSEKLKMTNGSAQFELWVRDYSRSRNVHAKRVIIMQTFGPESAKGWSSRENTWSGEYMYAKPQREQDLEPKTL